MASRAVASRDQSLLGQEGHFFLRGVGRRVGMLAVGLSYTAFIMLRYIPSAPTF